MNKNLIAFRGKKGAGKDTTYKIFDILTSSPHFTNAAIKMFLKREFQSGTYENKKFAEPIKKIVCIMLGCSMSDLENREFKNKILGPEWWYYKAGYYSDIKPYGYYTGDDKVLADSMLLVKPTPVILFKLIGTEFGRIMVHPNIWVNSLFGKYNKKYKWGITDLKFPNELEGVIKRDGIVIKVVRDIEKIYPDIYAEYLENPGDFDFEDWITNIKPELDEELNHESEVAIDYYKGDFMVIDNNKDLDHLIDQVRIFIKKLK